MSKYILSIPTAGLESPNNWGSRESIKSMMQKIWNNYGGYIREASENSKIPASVITSFIAVESGGDPLAGGNGFITQGLMQWNRDFAKAQLEDELAKKRMTEGEKSVLAKYGIRFDANGKTRAITNADQKKPELNITIGSIILGQLIDQNWGTDDKGIHLDRVIAVYNAGAFGETGKKARQKTSPLYDTPQKLSSAVNSTTRAYINKMMGVNGAMDIASSDLKNLLV
jgi:soluble lytic murein transglycosylase-like protein